MTAIEVSMIKEVQHFERDVNAADFISDFRDFQKFNAFCRECPLYNKSWACPPFTHDIEIQLVKYEKVLFHVSKIYPLRPDLPLSLSRELLKPERIKLERKFSVLEKESNGLFLGFAGSCPYCPENSCTRPHGKPCRFPHLCHPSLESYGFDLCKAVSEIFDFEILWSKEGNIPEYLTLVCGLFYNP